MRFPIWVTALGAGALLGLSLRGWWLALPLGLGGLLAAVLFARHRRALGLVAALCVVGSGYGGLQRQRLAARTRALDALTPGEALCVRGRIEQVLRAADGRPRLDVRGQVEGKAIAGRWRVSLGQDRAFRGATGDDVRVCGAWRPPFGFFNPGARDPYEAGAVRQDCGGLKAQRITRLGAGWGPRRWAASARMALSRVLDRLPAERAAFLRATVLGERAAVTPEVEQGFKAAGATHALSVSGLHLAAVAALFFFGLRRLVLLCPPLALRVPARGLAAALSIPAVVFYTLMTGEAVATWRSALMACVVFAAHALRRAPAIGASIAAAALGIGAHSVFWLWDLSFQLSVSSVVALALFAGRLGPGGPAAGLWPRVRHWLWAGLAATLAAGLLTAPLVAHHFGEVTPAAPVGNLVLTPLVELLVVPVGLVAAALGAMRPWLAAAPLWLADQAARLTMAVAGGFAAHAPVWRVNPPNLLETLGLTAGFFALLVAACAAPRSRGRRQALATMALVFAMTGLIRAGRHWQRRWADGVRVTFLDVGQGDAAVVQGPQGFVAVIDAGGLGSGFDTGARIVGPFLRREGIGEIHLLVLSHPHPDHAEGLPHLLRDFRVRALWMPLHERGPQHEGPLMRALRDLAARGGTAVPTPASLSHHGLLIEPLGPWVGDRIAAPEGLSVNDASLALRVSFAGRSILFAGDLEAPGEAELAERARHGLITGADVLKVPHHGSRTSSSAEFLEAVKPSLAVISAGRGNRFGFPHAEVLARFAQAEITTLRTDREGAVQVHWKPGQPLRVWCVRGCAVGP